jgi:hypothetical protein
VRLISPSGEARAYSARFDTSLLPTAPSSGGRVGQLASQHGSTVVLVRERPAVRCSVETRGSRPRGNQYEHYYATISARRMWTKGHWYYGRSEGAGRSGGQRYRPDRRPPVPGLTGDAVSTLEVPQGPVGLIGGRPLIISYSSSNSGGRRLAFQKPFLISGQGMCFDCSVFLAIVFAEWEARKI